MGVTGNHAELYAVENEIGSPRYIGVAKNSVVRQNRSWGHRKNHPGQLGIWLRSLSKRPRVRVLAVVEWSERLSTETRLIMRLRELGYDLVNDAVTHGEFGRMSRWSDPGEHLRAAEIARRQRQDEIRVQVMCSVCGRGPFRGIGAVKRHQASSQCRADGNGK